MKTVSFVRRKFNAMLGVATITMSVNYIVMLSGSVIVGNMVGPEGLAGVNTCTPIFGAASFIAALISVGSGLIFSHAMGEFDEHRARGIWTQSAAISIGFGIVIYLSMLFGRDLFLSFTGVTGAVLQEAQAYWRWQSVAMGLTPLVLLMEAMVYADGDGTVAAIAGACHVTGSIFLSMFFTDLLGNAGGVALGTAITSVLVISVSALHGLRQNNHLKFERYFSWQDLKATCIGSAPDASIYLCWGALIMVVNKFTVVNFGEAVLPVVALSASVVEFSIIFDGVGEAIIPLGGMYVGERNNPALYTLANHSAIMATLEGVFFGSIFFIFAPVLAPLYGIRGEAAPLLPEAISMMRYLAIGMPCMGFLMMANTHFLVVHYPKFAISVTVVKDFVLPCIFSLVMGSWIGFKGLWVGFTLGYLFAAVYPFAFVLLRYGKREYPWLVKRDNRAINFSIKLRPKDIVEARNRIEAFLHKFHISEVLIGRAMFTIEEAAHLTLEKNHKRPLIVEYFVGVEADNSFRLIMRDTGKAYDISAKAEERHSFRAKAFSAFLNFHGNCRYLNTLSCNRSEYSFKE